MCSIVQDPLNIWELRKPVPWTFGRGMLSHFDIASQQSWIFFVIVLVSCCGKCFQSGLQAGQFGTWTLQQALVIYQYAV